MIDCRIGLAGGDVVRRNNYRDVPLDFCPMQRLVDVFPPISWGNGQSIPCPGAFHELDDAGEEGRLVDGCVFPEERRLLVSFILPRYGPY